MLKNIVYTVGIVFFVTFNASAVWINEFHYDNTSTDVGEFVEIAGEAGTNLSGWSIVFYNGNGGAPYGTISLSGIIPDEGGVGYGALTFLFSGIQNGSPDGIALADSPTSVTEFLSYEGSLTAVGGPANGLTSTDVGVSEPSNTAIGDSLQLTGALASGFTWTGPMSESPGSLNSGQSFPLVEQIQSVPDGGFSALMFLAGLGVVSACRRKFRSR